MSLVQRLFASRISADHVTVLRDKLMPQVIEAAEAHKNLQEQFELYKHMLPSDLIGAITRVLESTNTNPDNARAIQKMLGDTDAPS